MQGCDSRAGLFRDIHLIYDITERAPGLPMPSVSGTRATFRFTGITHAADAARAVAMAETVLGHALGVTFAPHIADGPDFTPRYILTGYTASGLAVDIVAKAEHIGSPDVRPVLEDAPRLVAVAA